MTPDNTEAQKSPVHESTEDSTTEPSRRGQRADRSGTASPSNFERGAADRDIELTANQPGDAADEPEIGGGPGAADASSGGGAGAGIPGGGTDIRQRGAPMPG